MTSDNVERGDKSKKKSGTKSSRTRKRRNKDKGCVYTCMACNARRSEPCKQPPVHSRRHKNPVCPRACAVCYAHPRERCRGRRHFRVHAAKTLASSCSTCRVPAWKECELPPHKRTHGEGKRNVNWRSSPRPDIKDLVRKREAVGRHGLLPQKNDREKHEKWGGDRPGELGVLVSQVGPTDLKKKGFTKADSVLRTNKPVIPEGKITNAAKDQPKLTKVIDSDREGKFVFFVSPLNQRPGLKDKVWVTVTDDSIKFVRRKEGEGWTIRPDAIIEIERFNERKRMPPKIVSLPAKMRRKPFVDEFPKEPRCPRCGSLKLHSENANNFYCQMCNWNGAVP